MIATVYNYVVGFLTEYAWKSKVIGSSLQSEFLLAKSYRPTKSY